MMNENNRIKTPDEIEIIRKAGKIVALTLDVMEQAIVKGERNTLRLDELAEKTLSEHGAKSAFKGYKPPFHDEIYPHTTCISINNEVVHGLPSELKELKDGDIVGLDLGASIDGWYADSAITVGVGKVSSEAHNIMLATRGALKQGIRAAKPGNTLGDIGYAIETYAHKNRYSVAANLTGHFIGRSVHEEPEVPNIGKARQGLVLEPGMVFCIEPMFNVGAPNVYVAGKGFWTIVTADGSPSCHFEHTIAITDDGCDILTRLV